MQGGSVDHLLDVAVQRPVLDQLQVEVGRPCEDRVQPGLTGDDREERHLHEVHEPSGHQRPVHRQVPLRSHGSLSMNRALMAAGLVDNLQVTLFPVITGQTGADPIFQGAADFDLELVEHRTLDRHIQELIYRPTLH